MTTAGSMESSLPSSTKELEADLATREDSVQGLTKPVHLTAARLRFLLNLTGLGWAARGALKR